MKKPKPKRKWVVLRRRDVVDMGCKLSTMRAKGTKFEVLDLPSTMLRSKADKDYTYEERIKMNELLLMGAVWCEYGKRHFLTTLPPAVRKRLLEEAVARRKLAERILAGFPPDNTWILKGEIGQIEGFTFIEDHPKAKEESEEA